MKKYQLAPSVKIRKDGDKLYIGLTSQQLVIGGDISKLASTLKLCEFLQKPRTMNSIESFLECNTDLSVKETFNTFANKRLIVDAEVANSDKFNARDWLFYNLYADPVEVQAELTNKHVPIIGCGGIGAHVATMLRQAGVGQITLVDHDQIELSNLS